MASDPAAIHRRFPSVGTVRDLSNLWLGFASRFPVGFANATRAGSLTVPVRPPAVIPGRYNQGGLCVSHFKVIDEASLDLPSLCQTAAWIGATAIGPQGTRVTRWHVSSAAILREGRAMASPSQGRAWSRSCAGRRLLAPATKASRELGSVSPVEIRSEARRQTSTADTRYKSLLAPSRKFGSTFGLPGRGARLAGAFLMEPG